MVKPDAARDDSSHAASPQAAVPANVFLVGPMGAGKSTIGRAVATLLDKTFHDSDHEIEARSGAPIAKTY